MAKIVFSNIIPFKGFLAINLFGIIVVRKEYAYSLKNQDRLFKMVRHESIHTEQMKELLYIFFYLWYLLEYLIRLIQYRSFSRAYRNISFEREAFDKENDTYYLFIRKRYSFIKYLKSRS